MVKFGEYISLLSLEHWIYITSLVVLALLLFTNKEWIKTHRDKGTIVILIVSIAQQILLYGSYFVLYDFSLAESLPLHISRINSILGIIFLVSKNPKIYNVLCYFGIFAWLSFLVPSRVYGITHPLGISFFVNHVITLLVPYYGMIVYDMEIKTKDRNLVYFWFLVYLVAVMIINPLVDGNYFYLKHKPIFAKAPHGLYLIGLIIFTYFLFTIAEYLYLKVQVKIKGQPSLEVLLDE